jgi:hypothetical protein
MASFDELPPDQRAALQLVLQQGRSYDEIARLLRIEPRAVRERARAALEALGPDDVDGLAIDEQDDIADYLLGQQSASRRAATRAFLERSAAGRAWARAVAAELRPLARDPLPDIPAEDREVDEAFDALKARTEHRQRVERSSRVGGAILLGGVAVVLLVVILAVTGAFSGDDDTGDGDAGAGTRTTQTTATTPQVEAQINLNRPAGRGGDAAGAAVVSRQGNRRAVALIAEGFPAATRQRFYAIWLYTSPSRAKFLGFPNPQPDKEGRIETGFTLPDDATDYRYLVITRETEEQPRRPGTIMLRGELDLN